jgi:ATP-binding cassette subfamily B (MDR/TAP) protein 1
LFYLNQALTGEAFGRNVSFLATVLVGLGLSFGLGDWALGLLAFALVPVMASGMAIEVAIMKGDGGSAEGVGANASRLVSEVLTSVRTIASFTLEDRFMASFDKTLDDHLAKAKPKAVLKGVFTGYSQFALLASFATLYWFGGKRVADGDITFEEMLITIFGIFFMAAGFGAAGADASDAGKVRGNFKL